MQRTISVTETSRNFSDIINRVYYQRHSYLLTRGGTIVAQLTTVDKQMSATEFAQYWLDRPRLAEDDAEEWEKELKQLKDETRTLPENVWDI